MEIRITSNQILAVLHVLAWIIFLGLCVEAGSFAFSGIMSVAVGPKFSTYLGLDALFAYDQGHFLAQLTYCFIAGVFKALMFYLIAHMLYKRKLDLDRPFKRDTARVISWISYLCFGIGLFTSWGRKYLAWLSQQVTVPDAYVLDLEGADVWFFTAIAFLIIAQIFKRGIEIQEENELTI